MAAGDRYAVRVIAGVLAKERALRTGHPVRYEAPGIMSLAEEIVAELAAMNGDLGLSDTVIFKDGALGFLDRFGEEGNFPRRA